MSIEIISSLFMQNLGVVQNVLAKFGLQFMRIPYSWCFFGINLRVL